MWLHFHFIFKLMQHFEIFRLLVASMRQKSSDPTLPIMQGSAFLFFKLYTPKLLHRLSAENLYSLISSWSDDTWVIFLHLTKLCQRHRKHYLNTLTGLSNRSWQAKLVEWPCSNLYILTFWVPCCPEPILLVDWSETLPGGSAHTHLQTWDTHTHTHTSQTSV